MLLSFVPLNITANYIRSHKFVKINVIRYEPSNKPAQMDVGGKSGMCLCWTENFIFAVIPCKKLVFFIEINILLIIMFLNTAVEI